MADDAVDRQKFLAQLPRAECCICKEPYGTTDPDTGAVGEYAVRLPCSHVVGSACIAVWLSPEENQKTCPLCREEFFETTPVYDGSYGTVADRAIMRIAEDEEWELNDLKSWLRRRLDPNPPSTEAEVNNWWMSGCPHSINPEMRRWRKRLGPMLRIHDYKLFLLAGHPLPPLNPPTSPNGSPNLSQVDQSHEDALFNVIDAEGCLEHPYWQAVAPGASTRQIYDLITQEMYCFGAVDDSEHSAPYLAGWTGVKNDGRRFNAQWRSFSSGRDGFEIETAEQGLEDDISEEDEAAKDDEPVESESELDSEPEGAFSDTEDSIMPDPEERHLDTNANQEQDALDNEEYCYCHCVSAGNMIACDNYDCPIEWFHWNCVDVKTEPAGEWYCPDICVGGYCF